MKSFILIFVTVLASSCSFDNKTGIWKDASIITDENITRPVGDTDQVNQYEYIFTKKKYLMKNKIYKIILILSLHRL